MLQFRDFERHSSQLSALCSFPLFYVLPIIFRIIPISDLKTHFTHTYMTLFNRIGVNLLVLAKLGFALLVRSFFLFFFLSFSFHHNQVQKENPHYRVLNGQFITLFGVISFSPLIISKLFCFFKRKNVPAITLGRHVKIKE